jgi:hypothetical protein
MSFLRLSRRNATFVTIAAALLLAGVTAEKHAASVASMSIPEIEEQLQVGPHATALPLGLRS